MNALKRDTEGFTLVELIVVLVVLALLAAVLIPTLTGYINKARDERNFQTAETVRVAVQSEATALMGAGEMTDESATFASEGDYAQYNDAVLGLAGLSSGDVMSWSFELDGTNPYSGEVVIGESEYFYMDGAWSTMSAAAEGEPGGSEPASSYKPQTVAESAKSFEAPINAVLKALYDTVVQPRLGNAEGQISYVQFNNGKVTTVKQYTAKSATGNVAVSDVDLTAVNDAIVAALASSGYELSGTCRVFFDKDGVVVSGTNKDGGYLKIGGQGTYASLTFKQVGTNTRGTMVSYKSDAGGWE